jgi:hypothetical protein
MPSVGISRPVYDLRSRPCFSMPYLTTQKIAYAKTESDAVSKLKGTYKPKKRKADAKGVSAPASKGAKAAPKVCCAGF